MRSRFSLDALAAMPWKNGGGLTREIAVWPPGTALDTFDWRVSVASISASGPFSIFPGIDRVIMLLEGDGVELAGERLVQRLATPHVPFQFTGDLAIECTLLGGESTDFNVMTRSARLTSAVRVARQNTRLEASAGLVMCLAGCWTVKGERLQRNQGLWWADEICELDLDVEGVEPASMVCVTWHAPAL